MDHNPGVKIGYQQKIEEKKGEGKNFKSQRHQVVNTEKNAMKLPFAICQDIMML